MSDYDNGGIPWGYDFTWEWEAIRKEQIHENRCKAQQIRRQREKQLKLAKQYKEYVEAFNNRNKVAFEELKYIEDE